MVESASQAAITRSFTSPYGSTKSTMTALEKAELSRRFQQMWYNVLRGQFYERYTRYVFKIIIVVWTGFRLLARNLFELSFP
jgi:hypothetical protein